MDRDALLKQVEILQNENRLLRHENHRLTNQLNRLNNNNHQLHPLEQSMVLEWEEVVPRSDDEKWYDKGAKMVKWVNHAGSAYAAMYTVVKITAAVGTLLL